ncbi:MULTISPECIES: nucleotidyltransferase family protein [unclassified Roseofilum]|uniref:nucleotidyltransferase family protein n=1 Tax=unclassified Roseofilum TaxID=2620099 RepID=UPI00298DE1C8|nr:MULTISPECIES: nucleotidyltransferase domain-containing protein [unclassified Roseofilum]
MAMTLVDVLLEDGLYNRLDITPEQLADFCQRWSIVELALFGSILREDFNEGSDIDFLVVFDHRRRAQMSLIDLVTIEYELEDWLGRKVDLIEKCSVIESHNWIRRQNILSTARIIYESGRILFA